MRYLNSADFNPCFEDSLHNDSHNRYNNVDKRSKTLLFFLFTLTDNFFDDSILLLITSICICAYGMPIAACLQQFHIVIIEMHSASARFNLITLFTASVLAIMALVNFAHGYYILNPKVDVQLQIKDPTNFVDTRFWDQAAFRYNLYADLSSLYTWNLKQLYTYIEFDWVDPETKLRSRMIASDWILEIPEDRSKLKEAWTLNLTDARIEYLVRDVNHKLRGQNVTVSLNVEYMPIVGKFFFIKLYESSYVMPSQYSNVQK